MSYDIRKSLMRKHLPKFYLFLILALTLAGCGRTAPTMQPTQIEQLLTLTLIPPTATLVPTPIPSITLTPLVIIEQPPSSTLTPTKTMTPLNTLEPDKANEMIKTLLQEPLDCSAPCFWGIVPGQTSNEEAKNIFSHLGLQMASKMYEGKDFSSIHYVLDSGLSNWVTLTIQNNIVENIRIQITPEKRNAVTSRDWLAYSPETLIKRYGTPSRVDIGIDWGPSILFTMTLYFNDIDLIVDYSSTNFSYPNENWKLEVCPLTDQFDSAWLWMGKNPVYPPGQGVPLETVTSMTLDEFSKLMTGDPNNACFIVNGDVFK
jgi:hypothetical protein